MGNHTDKPLGQCRVDGCTKMQRNRLSPFCAAHARRKRLTGDPLGSFIPKAIKNPIIKEAVRYIVRNQNAAPIGAGLKWCEIWLQSGCSTGAEWRDKTPQQTVDSLILRLREGGVTPAQVLATLSAYYFLYNHRPGTFRSDDHFRYQMVKALLALAPLPVVRMAHVSGYLERPVYLEMSPKIISKGYDTLRLEILMLALKIADKLNEPEDWQHKIIERMRWPVPDHS